MFELYIKYLLEGIAVAVAAYFIPRKRVQVTEIIFIALSAAATFALLDVFAPKVGESARRGAGFGIGANTVGWPGAGLERFEDSETEQKKEKKEKTEKKDKKEKKQDKDETSDTKSTETFTSSTSSDTKSTDTKSTETKSTETTESTETKSTDSSKESTEVQPFEMDKKYSTY